MDHTFSPAVPSTPAQPFVHLHLLGRLQVTGEAGTIHLPARVGSLLAYLVLHPQPHAREQLATLFWGDVPDDQARHSLRTALNRLRNQLGDQLLLGDRERVQLNPSFPMWVDVREFEQHLARLSETPLDVPPEVAVDDLGFCELYHDDLLTDLYDDWILPEREWLSQRYQEALLHAVQRLRSHSEFARAIELAHKVLARDPTNERAYQHIMFCCAASGDRRAALKEYEACRSALRDELGVVPSSETEALYRWIKQARAETRIPEALVTNLPVFLTSFVGRQQEIAEITAQLVGHKPSGRRGATSSRRLAAQRELASKASPRLLTLIGAGGSGKTRLAIQAGFDLIGDFQDGVWWVDLAPLPDAQLVPQAVGRALGLAERGQEPITDTLKKHLQSKELLLLLDNCEHLLDACAQLAITLLSACPGLTILATSRAALNVTGETVWHVSTLAVPGPDDRPALPALREYSAVELFLERTAAVMSGFTLTADNAPSVIEVCRQLDGIPLAIELAARRMKMLTVEQIAERLANRFDLLTGGSYTTLPRHRTLRATIDWSCSLLSEQAQALFARISVFAGSWSLEAAEDICVGEGNGAAITRSQVLDLLTQLVDKSLVDRQLGTAAAEARFHMLETLRQYSAELLEHSGASPRMRERHALYYATLADSAEQGLRGPEMRRWLNRLELEHDNFRAALEWSVQHGSMETGLRFARGLGMFWQQRTYLHEGSAWLDRLLTMSAGASPELRAKALVPAGWFARVLGDFRRALALNEEALALCRQVGDRRGMAEVLDQMGVLTFYGNDPGRSAAALRESMALYEELGDQWGRAVALVHLGQSLVFNLEWDARTREGCEEGLAVLQEMGNGSAQAQAHIVLGLGAELERDHERARRHFEEGMLASRRAGDQRDLAVTSGLLSQTLMWEGHVAEGLPHAREALRLALELGEKMITVNALMWLAFLIGAQGGMVQTMRAVELLGFAVAWGESFGIIRAPFQRAMMARDIPAMRASLGEQTFAGTWARGRAMPLEEAIQQALSS